MKYFLKFKIVLIIFGSVFALAFIIYSSHYVLIEINQKNRSYPRININNEISGTITQFYSDRGQSYVYIDDTTKAWLIHSRNYAFEKAWLDDFIQVGDSISKVRGSDTLFIYRHSKKYYFVLGEFINKK